MKALRLELGINVLEKPEAWAVYDPPFQFNPRFVIRPLKGDLERLYVTRIVIGMSDQLKEPVSATLFTTLENTDNLILPLVRPGLHMTLHFIGDVGTLFALFMGDRPAVQAALLGLK